MAHQKLVKLDNLGSMTATDESISMSGNCCTRTEHVQEGKAGNKKEKQQGIILH